MLLTLASGAGGVGTSCAIAAFSLSACAGLASPFARRTVRLAEIVSGWIGYNAGGQPSERLMKRLGMPVSDTTILAGFEGKYAGARSGNLHYSVRAWLASTTGRWRKGHKYGTIIVDLEPPCGGGRAGGSFVWRP